MSQDSGLDLQTWRQSLARVLKLVPADRAGLVQLLREAQGRALLDDDQLAMIEGVLHVSEMQVRDIMIARSQMVVVRRESSMRELLEPVVESGHSRFPVIGENRDDVVGILIAKDLLRVVARQEPDARLDMRELIRPALFVPESKRLDVMLKEFRTSRNHLAVVVDEYGGVAGMVTMEDVLEQIVGEIDDEHDIDEDSYILDRRNEVAVVKALTPIEDFNEHFGTDYSDDEFDTIGGLVAQRFGRLPRRGESVVIDRHRFEVVRADNRRIHLLVVTEVSAASAAAERDGDPLEPPAP